MDGEVNTVQTGSGSNKKILIIVGVVAAIIIIAVIAFVLLRSPSEDTGASSSSSSSSSSGSTAATTEGPTEIYLKYKGEFDATTSFDGYVAVVRKYGSAAQVAAIAESEALSSDLKATVFSLAKTLAPSTSELDVDNIKETVSGSSATLIIDTKDGTMKGTITLVKEGGTWKLQEDSWANA